MLFQDVKMVIGQIWTSFHKLYFEKQKTQDFSSFFQHGDLYYGQSSYRNVFIGENMVVVDKDHENINRDHSLVGRFFRLIISTRNVLVKLFN